MPLFGGLSNYIKDGFKTENNYQKWNYNYDPGNVGTVMLYIEELIQNYSMGFYDNLTLSVRNGLLLPLLFGPKHIRDIVAYNK